MGHKHRNITAEKAYLRTEKGSNGKEKGPSVSLLNLHSYNPFNTPRQFEKVYFSRGRETKLINNDLATVSLLRRLWD